MTYSLVGKAPGSSSALKLAGHYSLLKNIMNFACGQLELDSTNYVGLNTVHSRAVLADNVPEEVWTVTYLGTPVSIPVANGDAETGDMTGWSSVSNWAAETTDNEVSGPYAGTYFFSPGDTATASATQELDLAAAGVSTVELDTGDVDFILQWRQSGRNDADAVYWTIDFLNGGGGTISSVTTPERTSEANAWDLKKEVNKCPTLTRKVRITMQAIEYTGTANNAYVDNIIADCAIHEFSVTGATSGVQAKHIPGSLYTNAFIQFFITDNIEAVYPASTEFVFSTSNGIRLLYEDIYVGVGNGEFLTPVLLDKVTETWTITCTVAIANGGTFSVVGSTSGAQANATVGTAYDNGIIKFLITDGDTDYAVSDVFTVEAKSQDLPLADRWEVKRFDDTADEHELIMEGPGIPGVGSVFAGFKTLQDIGDDYYNLVVATMEGFVVGNSFETQPKYNVKTSPLWNFEVPFWMRITARQISCGVDVESLYDIFSTGFYSAYYDPSQQPYPAVVFASLDGASVTRYSDTAREFGVKGAASRLDVLWLDGTYKQPETMPYNNDFWNAGNDIEPTDSAKETSYSGTGNGTLSRLARSVATAPSEAWTVTATSAANFTVVGAISGAQADATVGTLYDNGIIRLLLTAGGTAFVATDEFIFQTGKTYSLEKIVITDTDVNYGELEGIHFVTGFAQAVRNTVSDGTNSHIVLRNINRTDNLDYCTLVLD